MRRMPEPAAMMHAREAGGLRMRHTRVVVIGAGICGAMIARELTRYRVQTVLVDKEIEPASGTSKANNGIVHAGYAAKTGTLKARLNVRGSGLYRTLVQELNIPHQGIGSLVVALSETDLAGIQHLYEQGRANGVVGLEIWGQDRLRRREPHISPEARAALWAPTAAIICPYEAVLAAIENAVANGAVYHRATAVSAIAVQDGRAAGVLTDRGFIEADFVINAAGLNAAELARSAGDNAVSIHTRRGQYHILDRTVSGLVRSIIFPVPTPVSKGTVIQPTVDGNILVGPTAEEGVDPDDTGTTAEGLSHAWQEGLRLVPDLPRDKVIANYAGIRAVAEGEDFIVGPSATVRGLIHVAGIQSPGLAAAPAIAEMVIQILSSHGVVFEPNEAFNPLRVRPKPFREMNWEERRAAISADPSYGRVICRCETVTEAEVRQAIRGPVGVRTIDGIKRRTRAGMGRCQGGFCLPRAAAVLADELQRPAEQMEKSGDGSPLFSGRLA